MLGDDRPRLRRLILSPDSLLFPLVSHYNSLHCDVCRLLTSNQSDCHITSTLRFIIASSLKQNLSLRTNPILVSDQGFTIM
jgi:hypothetical protein